VTIATAAVLEPIGDACIVLESVEVDAGLTGLYSNVEISQTYRNIEDANIEAVYTFPLPLDAVLLDLVLELNGKTLRGVVQPKKEAEEHYEDAINEGDSAILLQQLEPGVFTLNVGNILPNEQAVVRFRYAQMHRWQGDSLRFHLPTTIAPRYGDPSASGMAPHQVQEYALSADRGFSLVVRIDGALAKADFDCPSHPVTVSTSDGVREISLSGGRTLMDRDFVLVMKEPAESAVEGLWASDDKEYVALASFHPQFPEDIPESPRCVKLVVDCSGSMGGDSIAQARLALREIISSLKPNDYFNLITFGSTFNLLFSEPVIANEDNIRVATHFVEQIDANMGGTEIGEALTAAYRCGKIGGLSADLLLITDGEIWNHEQVVKDAQKSAHRIFTVGVGSAVSEAFVRRVAETTSGACELVSPRENMSERIVRHFRRIDQPKAKSVHIEWPTIPIRQVPGEVETVYAGDTLHVCKRSFRGVISI
jgi:Ca-activated chloride channel family protein